MKKFSFLFLAVLFLSGCGFSFSTSPLPPSTPTPSSSPSPAFTPTPSVSPTSSLDIPAPMARFESENGKLKFRFRRDLICEELMVGSKPRVDCYSSTRMDEVDPETGVIYMPDISINFNGGACDVTTKDDASVAAGHVFLKKFGDCSVSVWTSTATEAALDAMILPNE